MKQTATRIGDIERVWYEIDAKDQILGRLSSQITPLLLGKNKPYFVPHLDCGDYVVVTNALLVKTTGRKEEQKVYRRYSGYPGGQRQITLAELRQHKPTEVIRHAVAGMLPRTKLGRAAIKKLFIYKDDQHPYKDKVIIYAKEKN